MQAFCGDCGTPIYACSYDDPTAYGLRIGALAERDALPPRRRIWCRSTLPWSQSLEGLPPRATEYATRKVPEVLGASAMPVCAWVNGW